MLSKTTYLAAEVAEMAKAQHRAWVRAQRFWRAFDACWRD